MDPLYGKPADPPQKPSAVAKFCGRLGSIGKATAKVPIKSAVTLVKWMKALGSYDTSVQLSRDAVLGIFKHRNASTDEAKQKKSLAVIDAMEEIGKDYADVQHLSSRKKELFAGMIKSSMGLSRESGCDSNARIANIHYWVIACERDINPKHLSPEAHAGLQIMQHFIREAADEFHQKNLAILGDAMTEDRGEGGEAPTAQDAAAVLLDCLSTGERHHHRAAKVGYDFGALKNADRTQEINDSGFLDSSILRNHYMAPKPGGLGIEDLDEAKDQHYDDWNNYTGPYSPDFWDGSPGRTLEDLMRHVDVEMLKENIDDLGGDSREIYDLRFPIVTPKAPSPPRPFADPLPAPAYAQPVHGNQPQPYGYGYGQPAAYQQPPYGYGQAQLNPGQQQPPYGSPQWNPSPVYGQAQLNPGQQQPADGNMQPASPLNYENDGPNISHYGINDHISVDNELDNDKEVISPRSLAWEEEFEEEDPIISELVDAPELEKEVIQLDERELDILEDDFVPQNKGTKAEKYHLPFDSQFAVLSKPVRQPGQGILIESDSRQLDSLTHSQKVDVQARRAAPKRSRAKIDGPDQPNLANVASGNIDTARDNKVTIRFFDDGMIALLDNMGIGTKDLELLEKHGEIKAIKDAFKANPGMEDADKIKLVQAKLAEVKGNLSPEDYLAHYHGMAPKGDTLDVAALAKDSLFSNLFGGDIGKTVAGALQDMAFQLRQGKLDEDKQVFLAALLEKKDKSLEDFESFEPENIFDAYMVDGLFNEEDLPALLEFTTGREVVILDEGANPSSYDRLLENEEGTDRIVFLKNTDGTFQVLGPISDEDEVVY